MSEARHIYSSELSDYAANPDGSIFYGIDTGKLYVKEGDEFHVHEQDSVDGFNHVGWTDNPVVGWDVARNRWVGVLHEGSTPADWQNYDIWKFEPVIWTLNGGARITNDQNLRGLLAGSDAGYNSRPMPFTISGPDAAHFQILHGFSQLHGSAPYTANTPYYIALAGPLDYDAPVDANGDNIYEIIVTAHDISGNSSSRTFELEITNDETDDAPRWDGYSPGSSSYNIFEGTDVQITNLNATFADRYEISGPDAAKFKVASSYPFSLTTNGTLDFENPSSSNYPSGNPVLDQTYQITITAYNDAAPVPEGGVAPPSSSHIFQINVLNDVSEDTPIWAGTSGSYNWAGGEDVLVDNIPVKMFTATYEENVTGYLFPGFSTHNHSSTNFLIMPWSHASGYGRDAQHFELVENQLKFKDGFVPDFENPGADPASLTPDNIYYVTIRAENVNSPQLFSERLFKVVITNNISENPPSFKDYNNTNFGYGSYQGAYVIDPAIVGSVSNIVATDAVLTQGSRTITTNGKEVHGWLNPGDAILIGPGSGMAARVVSVETRGTGGVVTPFRSTYPGIIEGDSTTPGATITIDRDYTLESVTGANVELIETARWMAGLSGQEVKEAQYAYFINTVGSNGAYTSQHGQVTFDEGTPSGASHSSYVGGTDGARFLIKTEGSAWKRSSGTTVYANNLDGLLIRPNPASVTDDSDIIHRGFTGLNFNLTAPRTIHAWEKEWQPNRTDRILQTQLNIQNLGVDGEPTATLNTQVHTIPRYKWLVTARSATQGDPGLELNSTYNFLNTRFGVNKNFTLNDTEDSLSNLTYAQQEEFWGPSSDGQPETGWSPFCTGGWFFDTNIGFGRGHIALDGISHLRFFVEGSWIPGAGNNPPSGRGLIGQNVPNSHLLCVNASWSLGVGSGDTTQWCMQSKLPAPGRDIRSVLSHLGLGNTRDNSILQLYGTSGGWADVGNAKGTGFILFKQQYANSNFINYAAQQKGLSTHADQGFISTGNTGPINFGDSSRRVFCHIKDFIIQGYYEHYYVYVKDATVIDPSNTSGPSDVTLFDTVDEAHNAAWGNYKRFSWYGPTTHVIDGEPARWETHGMGDGDNADKLLGAHVFEHSQEQNYDPEHGNDGNHWWSPVFDSAAIHTAANSGSATGAWVLLEPTGNPNRYRNHGPEYYSDANATGSAMSYDYGQYWYACRINTDSISAGGFNIGATTGDVVLNSTPHHSYVNWPQTTY